MPVRTLGTFTMTIRIPTASAGTPPAAENLWKALICREEVHHAVPPARTQRSKPEESIGRTMALERENPDIG